MFCTKCPCNRGVDLRTVCRTRPPLLLQAAIGLVRECGARGRADRPGVCRRCGRVLRQARSRVPRMMPRNGLIKLGALLCVLAAALGCARKLELASGTSRRTGNRIRCRGCEDFDYRVDPSLAENEFETSATDLQALWYSPMFVDKNLFLDQPIGQFYAKAVSLEFRKAGISSRGRPCKLIGAVTRWRAGMIGGDDFSFDVDAEMTLLSPGGDVLYQTQQSGSASEDGLPYSGHGVGNFEYGDPGPERSGVRHLLEGALPACRRVTVGEELLGLARCLFSQIVPNMLAL